MSWPRRRRPADERLSRRAAQSGGRARLGARHPRESRPQRPYRDVARRLAVAGYRAVAPDFLSPAGGTPADRGRRPRGDRQARPGATRRGRRRDAAPAQIAARSDGKVGAVGFCWGGGMVNRLAVAAGDELDAGVSFYGPAPDPAEAAQVQAPLLIHPRRARRAGEQDRPALARRASPPPAGRSTLTSTRSVNHAFHNDTSAERYDAAAAEARLAADARLLRKACGLIVAPAQAEARG